MSKINLSKEEVTVIHNKIEGCFPLDEEDKRTMKNIIKKTSVIKNELEENKIVLNNDRDIQREKKHSLPRTIIEPNIDI